MKFVYIIFYLLPKNKISHLAGYIAQIPIHKKIRSFIFGIFGRFFNVNFYEIDKSLSEFKNFQEFFTRNLKLKLRPISKSLIVSPCDGVLTQMNKIESGKLIQAKGKIYCLDELIGERTVSNKNLYYATIYLSPGNYHRFHMPCNGFVKKCRYIPGSLWPVNIWSVENIDQLFCNNERIVFWIGADLLLVAVGAMMVGRIRFNFDLNIISNISNSKIVTKTYLKPIFALKGDELGCFEFGSTIIIISPNLSYYKNTGCAINQGSRL